MSLPSELEGVHQESSQPDRVYTLAAAGLLLAVVIATAASWKMYPLFIDTYYHMAVIEGFYQAGGVTTRAFWEMAPGGRVHIYPPSLHVIGYFFHLLGMSPGAFMTLVSAGCYGGCLLTTWIWLRRILGPRSALLSLILLCGPSAFFWTQATFQAVAGALVLAPLALLALESERFLACGVLSFLAITMHPMGLFLPSALVINTMLRRKKIVAGLLAASIPVALYSPWLAHVWANRAFLPENRTGGEITLGGVGGGPNLGLLLAPLAVLALPWLIRRRGPALGLVGALLGFAVVVPMGFGSRFLAFNIHWPLAGLAGFGLGELIGWLEQRRWSRGAAQVFGFAVALTALVAYPAINVTLGPWAGTRGPGGRGPGGPPQSEQMRDSPIIADWRFSVQSAALPQLFAAYSGEGIAPGMGPGPGMRPGGMGPGMGPGQRPGMSPDRSPMGPGEQDGQRGRRGRDARDGRSAGGPMGFGQRGGGGGGMPGMNLLTRPGAEEFFEAVRTNVAPGDVIHMNDGAGANMITGATGRWTTSGILRDVRSDNPRTTAGDCDFVVTLSGGGMGPGGPGGGPGNQTLPSDFEKVFENDYGALYRNPKPIEHVREPVAAAVTLPLLAVMAVVGLLLVLLDFAVLQRASVRLAAAGVGTLIVALCLVPLANTAIGELLNPPSAPPGRNGPPGFGEPGFGRLGFDGPGQFLGQAFLREADADGNGTATLEEFKTLAGRWFKDWNVDRNDHLDVDEVIDGLASVFGPPGGRNGPMPMGMPMPTPGGPPGFDRGVFLGRSMFSAWDANGDGKLPADEFTGAMERRFREWDEESKGFLDSTTLGRGVERLLGPAPGF